MNGEIRLTSLPKEAASNPLESDANNKPATGHLGSITLEHVRTSSPFRPIRLEGSPGLTPSGHSPNTTSSEHSESESPLLGKMTDVSRNPSPNLLKEEEVIPTHDEKLHDAFTIWGEKLQEADRLQNRAKALVQEASTFINEKPGLFRSLTSDEKLKEEDLPRFVEQTIREFKTSLSEIQSAKNYLSEVVIEGLEKGEIMPIEKQNEYPKLYGKLRDLQAEFPSILRQLSHVLKGLNTLQEGMTDSED
ncbi:MAG: hypothetical protein K9M81_01145 [Chthoniobacterales bacterium]|nr:hypothetical protein [Chthoniobacterales bacterium]